MRALKGGAADFLIKGRLARLVPAVERELREAEGRQRRRAAERALEDVRSRMQLTLEALGIGICEIDPQTAAMTLTPEFAQLHGLDRAVAEQTLDTYLGTMHHDDQDAVSRMLRPSRPTDSDATVEYRVKWPDDGWHWIRVVGRALVEADGSRRQGRRRRRRRHRAEEPRGPVPPGAEAGGDRRTRGRRGPRLQQPAHGRSRLLRAAGVAVRATTRRRCDDAPRDPPGRREAPTALTRQLLAFSRRQIVTPQAARPQRASSSDSSQDAAAAGRGERADRAARCPTTCRRSRPTRADRAGAAQPGRSTPATPCRTAA